MVTTTYLDYQARMIARFGYRLSNAIPCPRVVAGKRCLIGYPSWRDGHHPCICQRYRPLLDHHRIWLLGRHHVLTSEPYHVDPEQAAAFARELEGHRLVLEVTRESYWFQGTTLLIVKRAEVQE